MQQVQNFLTQNPCYKTGKKIKVKGLMLHSVGCPQPSAESFIKKWNNPESGRACVHAFIDGNTGTVYQTLPWDHRGWHGGGSANNTHIGVEMCEPSCIKYTGGSSFNCTDRDAAMAVVKRTYDSAVELFAVLCKEFGLNPLDDGVIVSHKEGHDRGIASGHGDPDHLWNGLQAGYTMDGFRRDVAAALETLKKQGEPPLMPPPPGGDNKPPLMPPPPGGDEKPLMPPPPGGDKKTPLMPPPSAEMVHPGDKVRLLPGAAYYEGKEIPDWVINDIWIVKSVSGDRVVIDKNVSDTRAICSPVHAGYLKKE